MTQDIKLNILCVEDNRINQMLLKKALESLSCHVVIAVHGIEALSFLDDDLALFTQKNEGDYCYFDLILMDCLMPEMDGYQTTQAIRQSDKYSKYKNIPIVAMTGLDSPEEKTKCLNVGMNDFLAKPINANKLKDKLNRWVAPEVNLPACGSIIKEKQETLENNTEQPIVWDKSAFFNRVNYNDLLAEQLVILFLNDMPAELELLMTALEEGDCDQVHQLAHKIKGAVRNLSGLTLSLLLAEIESAAKLKQKVNFLPFSKQLNQDFMDFIQALKGI